ncbi:hypothetical protein L208DRAFT_1298681 [Tricholoma matsutake]|nr:hypothetical protein L208DRAFT_1298681 [Tricholoma matsutake 945]
MCKAQPNWVQVYKIGAFESPKVWQLLKCCTDEGTFEEVLFTIQGILKATDLPPLNSHLLAQYKYLCQSTTLTGLNSTMFDKAAQAMQEIYGHFYREFEDGTLVTWSLKGLDNDKGPELVVLNHYFTPTLDAGSDKHTPFGLGVDSNGVLACMLDGGGRSSTFVHTEDNQVHYHNSHVKLQGERE